MRVTPALTGRLVAAVQEAGEAILAIYGTRFKVTEKPDCSPVTAADLAAHAVISKHLRALTPDVHIVSEESAPAPFATRRGWPRHWLVDPLDGTREFVGGNGEFTVNVALIEAGRPVFGIVGAPVQGETFVGDVKGRVAYKVSAAGRQPLRTRPVSADAVTVVASRSHGGPRQRRFLDALGRTIGQVRQRTVGSSLKFCLVAQGEADFYPRLGPTSEWDIAAAEAVLTAAGGQVRDLAGAPLGYNVSESFLNPDFFAVGDRNFPWEAARDALAATEGEGAKAGEGDGV